MRALAALMRILSAQPARCARPLVLENYVTEKNTSEMLLKNGIKSGISQGDVRISARELSSVYINKRQAEKKRVSSGLLIVD